MFSLRHRDREGAVHQPLVVFLSEVPASTSQRSLVTDEPVRLTAWIRGQVQGVGMRWWIRSRALELGLAGWARNLEDGRVEVVAEGPKSACQTLLGELAGESEARRPGRIDSVVERWSAENGLARTGGGRFVER
jgi:acylphosphatase